MTYGILNSINKKDKLYKLLLKSDVNSNSSSSSLLSIRLVLPLAVLLI